jgi:hypothetical protein
VVTIAGNLAMLLLYAVIAASSLGQTAAGETPIASRLAESADRMTEVAAGRGVLVLTVTAGDTQTESWGVAGVVHDELVRLLTARSAKVLVSPKLDTVIAARRITGPIDDADLEVIRSRAVADLLAVATYRRRGSARTIGLTLRNQADGKTLWEGETTLAESDVAMAANVPPLNRKVIEFCAQNVGKQVGLGSHHDLAVEALAAAGARRTAVYAHGRKLGALDSPLPGDVIRIEDARFRGNGRWRIIGNGTAIVETVQSPTVLAALHQKDKAVARTTFRLHEKQDVEIAIYRPRPKILKALEPRSGADDSADVAVPIEVPLAEGVSLPLRPLEAGKFRIGQSGKPSSRPEITLSRPFHLGITEVTQAQWKAVMGENPSVGKGDDLPVTNVSWNDIQAFLQKLNDSPAGKSFRFRLPTSAEWEYACRAGSVTRYSFGDDTLDLVEHGWYIDNSDGQPNPVAQLRPNEWGLFDMHGNAWELTQDFYGEKPLGDPPKDATDPMGPTAGKSRVMRGGCFGSEPDKLLSANRGFLAPATRNEKTGFRIAAEAK